MSDKFEFIDAEYAAGTITNTEPALPIIKMCALLEVSRSGFYEWRGRPASATAERREELKLFIAKSFDDSDGTYGYRRVHADLADWGVPCGLELVARSCASWAWSPASPGPGGSASPRTTVRNTTSPTLSSAISPPMPRG